MDYEARRRLMRRLVLYSPQLSRAMVAGDFRSAFKGRGIDFDGLREYDIADDALRIDWNATGRFNHPFIKTYRDDRGLSVYLVVDRSASMLSGFGRSKFDTAALGAALLAHACMLNGIRVGGLFFGLPGRPGIQSVAQSSNPAAIHAFIEAILSETRARQAVRPGEASHVLPSLGGGSPLSEALNISGGRLRQRSMVLVFSDFMVKDYARPLALLARRHDVIAVLIRDQTLEQLTGLRLILRGSDAESGRQALLAPAAADSRGQWAALATERRLGWLEATRNARVPTLELDGQVDPALALIHFFDRRRGGRFG